MFDWFILPFWIWLRGAKICSCCFTFGVQIGSRCILMIFVSRATSPKVVQCLAFMGGSTTSSSESLSLAIFCEINLVVYLDWLRGYNGDVLNPSGGSSWFQNRTNNDV